MVREVRAARQGFCNEGVSTHSEGWYPPLPLASLLRGFATQTQQGPLRGSALVFLLALLDMRALMFERFPVLLHNVIEPQTLRLSEQPRDSSSECCVAIFIAWRRGGRSVT